MSRTLVQLERREQRRRTEQLIAARSGRPYPYRITQALDLRGLDGPEVDVACGAVEPAVDRWEAGTEVPSRRQIELLAQLTGMLVGWFFTEPLVRVDHMIVCSVDESMREGTCTVIDRRPAAPIAHVIPLHRGTLW